MRDCVVHLPLFQKSKAQIAFRCPGIRILLNNHAITGLCIAKHPALPPGQCDQGEDEAYKQESNHTPPSSV